MVNYLNVVTIVVYHVSSDNLVLNDYLILVKNIVAKFYSQMHL